jgi:DNA-binding NarL/FixJ family response regulator
MTNPIRIVLVDDHQLILDSLAHLMSGTGEVEVVAKTNDARHSLTLLENYDIDVLVTDAQMPGMSGVELCWQVRQQFPAMKILMLTMNEEGVQIREALNAGVAGYVLKKADSDELIRAIRVVAEGKRYFCEQVTLELAHVAEAPATAKISSRIAHVTGREMEILTLIAQEYSTSAIAQKLYVSVPTVETHRRNLLHKLGVKSSVGLALYATRHRLV